MSTNLGKRQRSHVASSPMLPTKDTPRTPSSALSPVRKRPRTVVRLVAGKENDPRLTPERKSRIQARATVREEADGADAGEEPEGEHDEMLIPKSAKSSNRFASPTRTPPKPAPKSRKSSVKKVAQTGPAPAPLPSLVSRLQHTPPATPPTTTLSLHARARALLRPGPGEVIGREKERSILTGFLSSFIVEAFNETGRFSAAYISGAPGTGKTALVGEILKSVATDTLRGIYVNCTGLKEENSVWARVLEEGGFGISRGKAGNSEKQRFQTALKTVVVLDELDFVLQSPSALSSIFAVAEAASSTLRIIGISNTLTLGASNPQSQPTNFLTLDMPAYTAEDIVKIVQGRLATLSTLARVNPTAPTSTPTSTGASLVIAPTALAFLSKKIAAQTGDLRAALDAVRRTIELAEREVNPFAPTTPSKTIGPATGSMNSGVATMKHVLDALRGRDGLAGGQAVGNARGLGMQARLVLVSILVARRRAAAGLVLLPVKSANSLLRTPSKAPRTPSRTGRAAAQTSPTKRGRASESEMYEASVLHAAYSAILSSDGTFPPVSRSEFQDLLGVLETGGLVSVIGTMAGTTPSRGTPSRRKGAAGAGEPLVGLAEGVREEDVLRGLGNAGVGGTAGVKEEEAMALWERELKRCARDVERVKRVAEREREAVAADGFADACAND
ncbi:enoyl-CoA hydratase/isomerase family protein [Ceratobasidium sp. AG-Ba]|nr:enoyl-CoA hydratase/isomerase family protein [Ceratobasidium sp. AG-Ba]